MESSDSEESLGQRLELGFDLVVPDGYQWSRQLFLYLFNLPAESHTFLVLFGWDPSQSSKKVDLLYQASCIHRESVTDVRVRDGTGFKTVLGDVQMPAGGRYLFQVKIMQGSLIKIGVCRNLLSADQVSVILLKLGFLR